MAKVKIKKNVCIGAAIHKVGTVAEVAENHAKILIEGGFAEKADPKTPVTPGGTVKAPKAPEAEAGE